ncbi:MAG: glycosyltransferase family 4 protein [Deltaproteobacteria bacterium]|nr:glycosyltransferase family 4 protein [Deltaproteobacteria bacterium]
MKLAFVHKRFGLQGGTERMMESLVRGLRQQGHEIVVFSSEVDPRFHRARLATFRALGGGGPGAGFRALRLWLSAALRVRRSAFDVVVHMGRTGPRDVYRAGGGSHRTWLGLLRSQPMSGWRRFRLAVSLRHRFILWHEKRSLTGPGTVVVPSEQARADLVAAYGELGEQVQVIPNGVDLDRFHPKTRQLYFGDQRDALGIGPEELVVLFVGSDLWRKGLDRVLSALARLAPREELRLLVLGDDRRRAFWEAEAERLAVRDRVAFLNAHDAPEKLFAAADLLVLPTRYDPFANVTLEALACGVPVVTSSVNGAGSTLGPSSALAILEDDDDADELAAHMQRMLQPDLVPALRRAAREQAERFGEPVFVARWEALLTQLAADDA